MLAIGGDEDRIRIPASENVSEPARRREEPAFSGERDDLERLGYRRIPWLIWIAAWRHREVHIAVGSDQKSDLRATLGDSSRGSGEQARRARPLASRVKKQDVQ
jgi:hypothetical protein